MTEDEKIELINKGVTIGIEHSKMSPETKKEIEEMKQEWEAYKALLRNIVLSGVVVVAGYGIWVGTIQQQITEHSGRISEAERVHQELTARQQSSEVVQADIRARLVSIELTLSEIKTELKKR